MAIAHYAKKAGYNFELFEASDVLGGNCITLNEMSFCLTLEHIGFTIKTLKLQK